MLIFVDDILVYSRTLRGAWGPSTSGSHGAGAESSPHQWQEVLLQLGLHQILGTLDIGMRGGHWCNQDLHSLIVAATTKHLPPMWVLRACGVSSPFCGGSRVHRLAPHTTPQKGRLLLVSWSTSSLRNLKASTLLSPGPCLARLHPALHYQSRCIERESGHDLNATAKTNCVLESCPFHDCMHSLCVWMRAPDYCLGRAKVAALPLISTIHHLHWSMQSKAHVGAMRGSRGISSTTVQAP